MALRGGRVRTHIYAHTHHARRERFFALTSVFTTGRRTSIRNNGHVAVATGTAIGRRTPPPAMPRVVPPGRGALWELPSLPSLPSGRGWRRAEVT